LTWGELRGPARDGLPFSFRCLHPMAWRGLRCSPRSVPTRGPSVIHPIARGRFGSAAALWGGVAGRRAHRQKHRGSGHGKSSHCHSPYLQHRANRPLAEKVPLTRSAVAAPADNQFGGEAKLRSRGPRGVRRSEREKPAEAGLHLSFWNRFSRFGGCTRIRTLDPLIKSQNPGCGQRLPGCHCCSNCLCSQ
jgi:hypothetical protein